MNNLKIVFTILILVLSSTVSAQVSDYVNINGILIGDDFKAIPFATIVSTRTGLGTISTENGNFSIRVKKTDSLKFSSIAYKSKYILSAKLIKEKNYIILTRETYQLNDVNVIGFTKWQEFKQEFMQKELKPAEQKILVIQGLPNPYTILIPNTALSSNPITLIYELFNKKAVVKRKQKRWNKTYNKSWQEFHKK